MPETQYVDAEEVYEVPMNGMATYQTDKAVVDMQIMTAKRFPRNLQQAINKAMTIATMDRETAAKCNYSLSKGGKNITGPSVHLARIIARHYGNLRVDQKVTDFDKTHVTAEAMAFDLETNYAIKTTIKKSLLTKEGIRVSEDMASIIGNAAAAIAFRNAIFGVLDDDIVNKVYGAVKKKMIGDVSTEEKLKMKQTSVIDGMIKQYSIYKLSEEEICKTVGKSVRTHLTLEDLITLSGFEEAIKIGEQSFDSIFRPSGTVRNVQSNSVTNESKEKERVLKLINSSKTVEVLEKYREFLKEEELLTAYNEKYKMLLKK